MIMLPSHGQITAAVKINIHWAGRTSYKVSKRNVFDKQTEKIFAEFLTLIFPKIFNLFLNY